MSIHLHLAPAAAGKTAYAVARACVAARGVQGSIQACYNPSLGPKAKAWADMCKEGDQAVAFRT